MSKVQIAVDSAGGQRAVARHFGIAQSSVWAWIERDRVPGRRVLELVELSGGAAEAHELNPEVFTTPCGG